MNTLKKKNLCLSKNRVLRVALQRYIDLKSDTEVGVGAGFQENQGFRKLRLLIALLWLQGGEAKPLKLYSRQRGEGIRRKERREGDVGSS